MNHQNIVLTIGDNAPDFTLPVHTEQPVRLSSLWHDQPLMLIFVRHLGCPLCRGQLTQMRDHIQQYRDAGAEVVAVTMSPAAELAPFREEFQLPFRLLSDIERAAYRAYGLQRGGLLAVAGPSVWRRGWNSLFSLGAGRIVGDPYQMSGSFVIGADGRIRLVHYSKSSADWGETADQIAAVKSSPVAPQQQNR